MLFFQTNPVPGPDRRDFQEDNILSQPHQVTVSVTAETAKNSLPSTISSDDLLARILSTLDDDKAVDVISIDLRGKSEIADHMVICSGRSTRQVTALSDRLTDRIKQEFKVHCKVEGRDQGDWVLIDAGDVIVHVFRPEVREFYQLEKLWTLPRQVTDQALAKP